jgi:Pyridoxamine 5'-phosphate oxidase
MNGSEDLIPEYRCWQLLATTSVGRLALSVRALPVILPVQYHLDGRSLVVCLGHHQIPERSLNQTIIAFAADAIDPATRGGWSVHVQGPSAIPQRLAVDTTCGQPAAGQIVRIHPGIITGHRVHLRPFIDPLPMVGVRSANGQMAGSP